MEFQVTKEELIQPLQKVVGIVDKKQLQPILSCVLLTFSDNELIISATDLDIELSAKIQITPQEHVGKLALPGRKLLDICKSLPDNSRIKLTENDNGQVILLSNKTRFTLSKLNANDFPLKNNRISGFSFAISRSNLKSLLHYSSFAIAQQDVRHYLMGMLWEFTKHQFKVVATDGHRLATISLKDKTISPDYPIKVIVPRKGINELSRLLDSEDGDISLNVADSSIQIETNSICFTTKLIESQFPDYNRVFPSADGAHYVDIDKEQLKNILARVSILSNEKHRAVRFCFSGNQLVITANNQEQEQAEELIELPYEVNALDICFNYGYLMDVLLKASSSTIRMQLKQANTPILITPTFELTDNTDVDNEDEQGEQQEEQRSAVKNGLLDNISYIIMPMCL
jgi:DNA polymerase-3 subunit beta